ncbi:carbon-nitrogen hydrolase [Camillea tinctor]|nr:carbon-nitrogen hydrolase [Camillea tinctor]
MKIACLQFAPQVGDVDNNLNRADSILNRSNPGELDLLVLPELAFTGYNFKSLHAISPFLEPTGSGITSVWARTTALKHNCKVVVGYPETADVSYKWPTSPEYYNSAIVVNEDGDTCGHYRKSHLYYTDETWALEGTGFFKRQIPGLGKVAMGICMDINPYRFEAPWNVYEFGRHVLDVSARVVIVSMAWLTREDGVSFSCRPKEPDMETLTYWITRLEPLIRAETDEEIIVIFANRTGIEDDAVYAGTSAVIGIKNGEVTVYGLLGRGEKELLVVDTDKPGFAKLVYRPDDDEEEEESQSVEAPGSRPGSELSHKDPPSKSPGGSELSSAPRLGGGGAAEDLHTTSKISKSSKEANRRSFGGHILVDADAISPPTSGLSEKVYNESPISPRYFWEESLERAPLPSQFPNMGIHTNFEEWRDSLKADYRDVDYDALRDNPTSPQTDLGSGDEFSSLVKALDDPASTTTASINRPFSTKSRNASKSELSGSKSDIRNEQPNNRSWQDSSNHSSPLSDKASRSRPWHSTHQSLDATRGQMNPQPQPVLPSERYWTMSPDLDKIGAELMVFEEESANRTKRDSLVCHVDEDNYIALRAARKDATGRKNETHRDERSERSRSRHSPRHPDSSKQHSGRSRTNSRAAVESPPMKTTEKSSARTSSRGRHRDGDSAKPRNLSKKTSHGTVAAGATSPPVHYAGTPKQHRHRHRGSGISDMDSLQFGSSKHDAPQSRTSHHHRPEPTTEQKSGLPIRTARHSKRESDTTRAKIALPSSDSTIMFSPDILGYSPGRDSAYVTSIETHETGLTMPDRILDRPLPTPKAMVLPRDYDSGANGHQSAPLPPRNQAPVVPLKCLDEKNDVQIERPRSAVW